MTDAPSLTRRLADLDGATFDIVVVGGGITGAFLAWDAALRGLRVALVEKDDFGGATSAASSKLLHSGVRYLQQGQLGKVRESAVERAAFARIAPHLAHYVPFLIPTYQGATKGRALVGAGLALFGVVSFGSEGPPAPGMPRVPKTRFLSKDGLVSRYPLLGTVPNVTGAWMLHELHMHNSERMTLAVAKSAAAHGAVLANYVRVVGLTRIDDGAVVSGVDALSGATLSIRARLLVNAAGPWIAPLSAALGVSAPHRPITGFSKGAHLVVRHLLDAAVALPTRQRGETLIDRGGRHFFLIPWRGRTLVGTTNVPFDGPLDEVGVTRQDVTDFLAEINDALPGAGLRRADVEHAFAGVYPLTRDVIRPGVYQMTGDYQAAHHGKDGTPVVTVLGAKYTTARRVAERALGVVVERLGRGDRQCRTATTPLTGAPSGEVTALEQALYRSASLARRRHGGRDPGAPLRLRGPCRAATRRRRPRARPAAVPHAAHHRRGSRLRGASRDGDDARRRRVPPDGARNRRTPGRRGAPSRDGSHG